MRSALGTVAAVVGVVLEISVIQQWRQAPGRSDRWVWAGACIVLFNSLLRVKLCWVRGAHPVAHHIHPPTPTHPGGEPPRA